MKLSLSNLTTFWEMISRAFIKYPSRNTSNKALSLDSNFQPIWIDFPSGTSIGTAGTNSGTNLALKIDIDGNGYVQMNSGLLTYKGSIIGSIDALQNIKDPANGDVYSLKANDSDDNAPEYVYVQKDSEAGYWEYFGKKFQQVKSDWNQTDNNQPSFIENKPELFDGNYSSLTGVPTLSITKPTSNADGSITLGSSSISIKNHTTVKSGADILVSQAYVDAKDTAIQSSIPTQYVKKITVNGDESGQSGEVSLTIPQIFIAETEYKPDVAGKVTLPKYPEVLIEEIQVDEIKVIPSNGIVKLTTPDIPIKSIKVGNTNLTPDNQAVTIPETLQFATKDPSSNLSLAISDFVTDTPTYTYEKTILIHNTSTDSVTVSLPATTEDCTVVPMTESLSVPAGKYCEVVGTYYHDKKILTINGGVQV